MAEGNRAVVKTVLVGYTETDAAERALARAADLAEAFRARLVVVSVGDPRLAPVAAAALEPGSALVVPPAGMAPVPPVAADRPASAVPEPEELARRELDRARSHLARRDVDAEYVSEIGDPADRLLEAAERYDADVIVVGSREHGLLERLLAPPVEDAVVRRADRDILLVH
jgi:nucleotide-binding universal stress UspA family protein